MNSCVDVSCIRRMGEFNIFTSQNFSVFNVSWILFKDRPTLRKTGLPRQIDKSDSYAIYPLLPKWEFVRF